ncbi:MAG: hypothetical protein V4481_01285 [Patescibacteria group bacterium]
MNVSKILKEIEENDGDQDRVSVASSLRAMVNEDAEVDDEQRTKLDGKINILALLFRTWNHCVFEVKLERQYRYESMETIVAAWLNTCNE